MVGVPLSALVIPIVVSAIFVFAASSVIHMMLGWHAGDLSKLPNEDGVRDALRPFAVPPGTYGMPHAASASAMNDPAFLAKMEAGPNAFITMLKPGKPAMGKELTLWFLYSLVVSLFAAYIAGRALGPGAYYLDVFRFAGTTAFAGYALGTFQESIWWHRKWSTTAKNVVDGLIYAGLTAGTFGWLWPSMM